MQTPSRATVAPDAHTRLHRTGDGWAAGISDEPGDALAPPFAAGLLLLSAFVAVIVFLPPEGRVMAPLHDGLAMLLGRATFMLPLGLAVSGVLLVVHERRPDIVLPRRRLTGVGLIALAILPIEHLLPGAAEGTGLVGQWLTSTLLDLLGTAVTILLLAVVLALGTLLAFDVKLKFQPKTLPAGPDAAS